MDAENTPQRFLLPAIGKPLKPRKFRSSCDACSASKVKCDQGRPQCQRCINLRLRCHYSPSRRMGKPPAASRKITNTSTTSSLAKLSSSDSETQCHPAKKRQLSSPSFLFDAPIQIPTMDGDQAVSDCSMIDEDSFMTIDWQDGIFPTTTFDGPAIANISLTNSNLFDLSFDFTTGFEHPQLRHNNQFIFGDDSCSNMEMSRAPSRDPTFDPFQRFPFDTSLQPGQDPSPPLSRGTPKLCTHNLDVSRATPPSPYVQTDASIDQVLIKNKARIDNAYALLSCSCSDNPHIALTLALICIKILGHYEDVIKAIPPSLISRSSNRCGSNQGNPPNPVTVGAYKMDAEDEERMRIQIVVNEIGEVKGLVDEYARKYCYNKHGGKRDGCDGIYGALEVFLRSKLTNTLQDSLRRLEC